MKCFHFPQFERKDSDLKATKASYRISSSGVSSSGGSNFEARPSGSELNSQTDVSFGSPDTGFLPSISVRHNDLRVFSLSELKVATRNFHHSNKIGEGGFGSVYKGWIKLKGSAGDAKIEVAVKQLNGKGMQGRKQWLSEVKYLGVVDHPNLVKLIGYCSEDDSRGPQMLLVYAYMSNGSVDATLFGKGQSVLPWKLRIQIALGAAQGLAYLHEEMDFQVIFRDFKTSNILLDADLVPKLSDFGLARQGPDLNNSHVSTVIVGTAGYAAPEYLHTGHLTAKSDVWSFGVVLFELLTGRPAVDKNLPKNEVYLLDWVRPSIAVKRKFHLIMDPRLGGRYSLQAAHKIAVLAAQCLSDQPKARPKMSEVVEQLRRILEICDSASPESHELKREASDNGTSLKERCSSKQEIKMGSRKEGLSIWHKLTIFRLVKSC